MTIDRVKLAEIQTKISQLDGFNELTGEVIEIKTTQYIRDPKFQSLYLTDFVQKQPRLDPWRKENKRKGVSQSKRRKRSRK